MKNILFLLSFFFLFACGDDPFSKVKSDYVQKASVRDNSPSKFPVMSFNKTTHDFGVIQNGTPVETVFSYTNTGEAPLVITVSKAHAVVQFLEIGVENHLIQESLPSLV